MKDRASELRTTFSYSPDDEAPRRAFVDEPPQNGSPRGTRLTIVDGQEMVATDLGARDVLPASPLRSRGNHRLGRLTREDFFK